MVGLEARRPTSNGVCRPGNPLDKCSIMLVALLFLLALGFVLLAVAALAMRRQLRLGREALAPVGGQSQALMPRDADLAPIISAASLSGDVLTIGGTTRDARPQLLIFIEGRSALCDAVVGDAVDLCRGTRIRLTVLGDGAHEDYTGLLERYSLKGADFILNAGMGEDFQIGPVPSAVLIDGRGQIVARGTVQRREQLKMLLESMDCQPEEGKTEA